MAHRFVAALAVVAVAVSVSAAPEPEPFPTRWEFDMVPGDLRFTVVEGENGEPTPVFYLTYAVTNYSSRDRIFAPSFELLTDQGQLLRAGRGVVPEVTRSLLERLDDPFLEDQFSIVDTLRQGRENTRFGLVVWPATDLDIDEITIFAAGFSGESTTYFTNDPESGRRNRHILRKTRVLEYDTPGNLVPTTRTTTIDRSGEAWVMR
ncbi:MAG: hypothetical protein CMJ31_14980 [Phycisphaerae bacterium]|nr:hypothetical protein [Phycisphaerae bacterium]